MLLFPFALCDLHTSVGSTWEEAPAQWHRAPGRGLCGGGSRAPCDGTHRAECVGAEGWGRECAELAGSGGLSGWAPECQRLLTTWRDRQYKHELKSWPGAGLEVPSTSSEPRARWQAPQDILRAKPVDGSLPRWACARPPWGGGGGMCRDPASQETLRCPPRRWSQATLCGDPPRTVGPRLHRRIGSYPCV